MGKRLNSFRLAGLIFLVFNAAHASDNSNALFDAIKIGDLKEVSRLVDAGVQHCASGG